MNTMALIFQGLKLLNGLYSMYKHYRATKASRDYYNAIKDLSEEVRKKDDKLTAELIRKVLFE